MKKLSILALAALAMVSCGNTYKVKNVELNSLNDSVNYTLGFINGYQIKSFQLRNDSSDATITEFISALDRGYNGKTEELSEIQTVGRNIGQAVRGFEKKGLVEMAAFTLNEKIFFQGLVNGLLHDTTMMQASEARGFFQEQYQLAAATSAQAELGKAVKAKCGKKAATIALKSLNDSVNYAFGVMNGFEISMEILAQDSTGEDLKEFVAAVNKGLKSRVTNPQIVTMGEQIGQTIKEQEANGLIGVAELTTDFSLIKQGFINGLYQDETMFTSQAASEYIQNAVNELKYGANRAAGEKFLEENKLKEGVITTESGLQYEVLTMGKGKKPAATDKVKVHYHGTLIDGTVFDSSVERGEPIVFGLDQVIKGWTEGVQLMPVGSKFRFYIPQELAYGEREAGSIPAYSTLIFDVELLSIEK